MCFRVNLSTGLKHVLCKLSTAWHLWTRSAHCVLVLTKPGTFFSTKFYQWLNTSFSFQPHVLLQRVKSCISDEEEEKLMQITSLHSLNAFLLPIKTVGVQVNLLMKQRLKIITNFLFLVCSLPKKMIQTLQLFLKSAYFPHTMWTGVRSNSLEPDVKS